MSITYKELAELAGVSRGTVDRALHNRGRIDPKVKERILQVAQENGFQLSHVGRALAQSKNPIKIGVVLPNATIPFFSNVIIGIEHAKKEIEKLGAEVFIKRVPNMDANEQIMAIDELLAQGIKGLAICPVADHSIKDKFIDLQQNSSIPIITFNSDIDDIKKLGFVGINNYNAGETSAFLMNLLTHEQEADILVINGFLNNRALSERLDGFAAVIEKKYSCMHIPSVQFNQDDEELAYNITYNTIKSNPNIKGIYMISGGQAGVCKALQDLKCADKVGIIMYDTLDETVTYLKNNIIDFVIDQNSALQGYRPVKLLFDYLFYDQLPQPDDLKINFSIKTPYNI